MRSGRLAEHAGMATLGLSTAQAHLALERHGANSVEDEPRLAPLALAARQFRSPLVLILVFGAAVSAALRNWFEASIILAIVAGSAALGFAQEYRAGTAVSALRRRLALTAEVVRDGAARRIATAEI